MEYEVPFEMKNDEDGRRVLLHEDLYEPVSVICDALQAGDRLLSIPEYIETANEVINHMIEGETMVLLNMFCKWLLCKFIAMVVYGPYSLGAYVIEQLPPTGGTYGGPAGGTAGGSAGMTAGGGGGGGTRRVEKE